LNNRREEEEKAKGEKAIHDEELVEVEYDVDEKVMEMKTVAPGKRVIG